jgi:hypothetical protein
MPLLPLIQHADMPEVFQSKTEVRPSGIEQAKAYTQ